MRESLWRMLRDNGDDGSSSDYLGSGEGGSSSILLLVLIVMIFMYGTDIFVW